MSNVIQFNKTDKPITDLVDRLKTLSDEGDLKGLAAVYITESGDTNYIWSTPDNTIQTIGGLEIMKLDMIERDIVKDDI